MNERPEMVILSIEVQLVVTDPQVILEAWTNNDDSYGLWKYYILCRSRF